MRVAFLLSTLLAPLVVAAAPLDVDSEFEVLTARQANPTKPPPCVRISTTTEWETKARADAFAYAFIYKKDITEAFRYIAKDYINHNPLAQNGSDSAWGILSPIWASQDITPIRTTFKDPQSWLNYKSASFGTIVDRFRWEGGCIAEHWDQGEKYPTTKKAHGGGYLE